MTDITKKQYMLSSCRRELPSMQEISVESGFLYVHPALPCHSAVTADGKTVWLLGHAYCMDTVGNTPLADITAWDGADLTALTRFWTGRWALICGDRLVTDACGLMAAFYHQTETAWCISSSLALLCREVGIVPQHRVPSTGLNWRLLPHTRADGVSLPLCTQRLVLGDTLCTEPHCWIVDHDDLTTEEKCEEVARLLVNGVANIHRFSEKQIHVALTGGKDSRLVLAALLKAGVPFQAYTAAYDGISSADTRIPTQLAKRFGFKHTMVKPAPVDAQRLADHDMFTAENTNGADRQFYARGQFDAFADDALILRGGLFEAAQTYARSYTAADTDGFAAGMRRYYTALTEDTAQAAAFEAWLQTVRNDPIPSMDIRDRFYIEQRAGGWAAAIEQSLDLNDLTSVQIANCAALLSVLLSATEEQRQQCTLNVETIRVLQPALLEYAVNKRTVSDRLRYVLAVLKHPIKKLRAFTARL